MALNFSHRPIFPPHLTDENLVSSMSISSGFAVDGVSERNSDVYGTSWLINRELVDCLNFLEDTCEGGRSRDCVPGDVLDLLPSDPFGMDMSSTFTAITGWLDDLNVGYGRYGRAPNYELFAEFNYIWNSTFRFQAFSLGNEGILHSTGKLGRFGAWSDERKAGGMSCHSDPESPYLVDTIQTLGIEPEVSGDGFCSWSDGIKAGGLSCHSDPEAPYLVDTFQNLGIEPEISGDGFSSWSDGIKAGGLSCHLDPELPYLVDTIQTLGIEPEVSGDGFSSWSDGIKVGLSCHSDPESPYLLDAFQNLGIEPEISGDGFSSWSDGIKAGGLSCHSDPESPYLVDTFQTLGIEPEISGDGFSSWSDGIKAGGLSCHSDPESPYLVDTFQTLGIEPEISGDGFSSWSGGIKAGGLSCHTDPRSSYVVDTIQTFGIEPEISGGGFNAWSDGRKAGAVSFQTDPRSSYVVDTIQTLVIEPAISGGEFGVWSDGIEVGGLSCLAEPDAPPYVVDTIKTLGIEPEISGGRFSVWSDGRKTCPFSCHTEPQSSYVVDTIKTLCIESEISGVVFVEWSDGRQSGAVSCFTDPESPPYFVDTCQTLGTESETSGVQPVVLHEGDCVSFDARGPPHAALNFVLGYLGTRELLVVESVCKSLQSTAEGDPFFWRNINICGKLDVKITDDVLLKLTSKAQGGLESLSLVNCVMISDDGLKEVLLNNPKVTKLCVPGCTRLTIGGIVDNLKAFKSRGGPGIKHLSIAGMYGVTEVHFKELEKLLVGIENFTHLNAREPRFYRGGEPRFPSSNGGRAIDIERCPKCMNMRIVYDCPVVGCKGIKEGDTNPDANTPRCRACTLCIARCNWCGRCIDETVHEETFCLDLRCIDCGKEISKCE